MTQSTYTLPQEIYFDAFQKNIGKGDTHFEILKNSIHVKHMEKNSIPRFNMIDVFFIIIPYLNEILKSKAGLMKMVAYLTNIIKNQQVNI